MKQELNNVSNQAGSALFTPDRPFKGYGGVRLPEIKGTANSETEVLPLPEKVCISMQQHLGVCSEPVVKVGDSVEVGQLIGDSKAELSAPVHSGVSGKVTEISELMLTTGQKTKAVVIEADGMQTVWSGIRPPRVNSASELLAAVRASGLVGLGGAGFPVHAKLNVPRGKSVDTLIINGAECEPYLTADYREMVECAEDIIEGIQRVRDIIGVKRVIIGIEADKPVAIRTLSRFAESMKRGAGDDIYVLRLQSSYPQGAEKVLIYSCTGRRVPKGGLPVDAGCIVMNVASVSFLAKYLKDGMPLINKRLTVDGSAIVEPKNVIAPIGTSVADIIDFCGGYRTEPKKILMGGPMMGVSVFTDDTPILKQNNGLLVLASKDVIEEEETDCIHCGRCVNSCPMRLQPLTLEKMVKRRDMSELERGGMMSCVECGACAYVCPARRKLVQYMRMGKAMLRKAGGKK